MLFEEVADRNLQIGGLTLIIDLNEGLIGFLVETDAYLDLFIELRERFKHLQPVQIGVVLSEGPREVIGIDLPLQALALVDRLFLERVACLVGLESIECNSGLRALNASVFDRDLQDSVGHGALTDILEILQNHGQK